MNYKISFTTMATPELDVPSQAAVAREYKFDGVDLRIIEKGRGEIPPDLTQEQADVILDQFGDIEISSLMCYNKNIASGHEEMVESILNGIRIAKLLKTPVIRIFSGRIETEEDLDTLVAVLKTVLERDNSNIKIGIQNHVNHISALQTIEVCERVNSPRIGIILSPDQSVARNEDYVPLLPRAAKHTFQLYVADKKSDNAFVLIGTGMIDNARNLRVLRENGFDGYVTLKWEKVWIPELPDYPEGMRSFMTYLQEHCDYHKQ